MVAQPCWPCEFSTQRGWRICSTKENRCLFAHHRSHLQIKLFMNKGERISRFVAELGLDHVDLTQADIAKHPFYRAFFRCWNEQRYYEAHDVLEQLWLKTDADDGDSNIPLTRNIAGVCRRLCAYFGWRKRTYRPLLRDIMGWMLGRSATFCAHTPIKSSRPTTRLIHGHRRPRRNWSWGRVGALRRISLAPKAHIHRKSATGRIRGGELGAAPQDS